VRVGRYLDGRTLDFDEKRRTFDVDGDVLSPTQVRQHATGGQMAWLSDEIATWFEANYPAPTPAGLASMSGRDQKILVGVLAVLAVIAVSQVFMKPSPSATPATTPAPRAAPATAPTPAAPATRIESKLTEASVLVEMQSFQEDVTGLKLTDDGAGEVRLDLYTDYYPDSDVAEPSRSIAQVAAGLDLITSAYPKVTISAYVWPKSKAFYLARAEASWTNGRCDAPYDVYLNDVLK
jgi:hypothetical protein